MGVDLFDALGFRLQDSTGAHIHLVDSDIKAQYPTLFEGFGECLGYCHAPRVDPTIAPKAQALRRLPFSVREEVSTELHRLEADGIIEKIDSSPWISNLVIARRKNGELRLCIDLKEVNKAIIPDKYPLPTIDELSASFHGAQIFTKLDMRRSYLQVPLAAESRNLTAFVTHEGVFQYRRMPYGLSSAPSAFQKIVSSVLSGIPGVLNLLDDVVVCGTTTEEHDRRLHEVLARLEKHRFTLNEDKCRFAAPQIDFVGYRVTAEGVTPTHDNAAAIQRLPTPTNTKELASFLGTTNFYLKFVPRYAEIAEPLRKLLRKDTPWEWNAEHESAFNELKRKIVSPQILAHFDPSATTFVTTDASNSAVGAVLSQEINGAERPVAFASRTLSETERKYSTGEREALACIFACEHWHIYLFGRKFTLRTDHQALTTLLATSGSGHKPLRIYRWSDRLHQYNFDVEYLAGSRNQVADMLSRTRIADSDNAEVSSREIEEYVNAVMTNATAKLVTRNELKTESQNDAVLQRVREYITTGWPTAIAEEMVPYHRIREELAVFDEYAIARGTRAVIPASLQQRVLELAHAGHPGIVKMKQKCRECIWWPGIDKRVEQHVKHCESCTISEKAGNPRPAPLQPTPWPQQPWEALQVDIFGEVAAAPHSQRFLVVVHDLHSKWPEIAATSSITTTSVINILDSLFTKWGLPKSITTDNGPQFVSDQFEEFLASYGIQHNLTSRYNPQSNGGVERFNRVIKDSLKASLSEGKTFETAIHILLRAYRSTPHALTGRTPAELMIGRKLRMPLNVIQPSPPPSEDVKAKAEEIAHQQAKTKSYTDERRHAKPPRLAVGDWVRIQRPNRKHKLASGLSQPKRIARRLGNSAFQLEDGTKWNARRLRPSNRPGNVYERDDDETSFPLSVPSAQPDREERQPQNVRRSQRVRRQPRYLQDYHY